MYNQFYRNVLSSAVNATEKAPDSDLIPTATSLCSDPILAEEREKLFESAEEWLNSLGIKTRTEYNNLLPTYNLFLEIGEYLRRN